jgi:2-oxoglutarate dehydrogenase E2 component (dihydrolipoamide succinyltransferase)
MSRQAQRSEHLTPDEKDARMAVEIRVPTLGESVVEATIAKWLKQEGDHVGPDDVVVELETDKINVEVNAPAAGVLEHIARREGEIVGVNELLAMVGDGVSNGATAAPIVAAPPVAAPATDTKPEAKSDENGHKPFATPVAEKMAADNKVDLARLKGSGVNGKITIEDVKSYLDQPSQVPVAVGARPQVEAVTPRAVVEAPAAPRSAPPPPPAPPKPALVPAAGALPPIFTTSADRREEREPMSRLRQTIAERLVEAQHTAAMLTTFNEVDMTAIMDVRKRRKDSFKERYGVNLGFMSFFTKATVGALKSFPYVNAEIQGKEIVKKYYYDIGIAVGTEKGLVVPVLRDADRKTFAAIEKDIVSLATRAREGKLTLPDLTGGTFTITNGGVYGSLMSTPILNTPQVGILGMHKIQERPMAVNGQVVIKPMMYLALSYDHRIVDGSEAVRFLVRIKDLLEDPESLLLEG